MAQGRFVGNALSGNFIPDTGFRDGAYERQACYQADAVVEGNRFQWSQPLIVVHCQYAVELRVHAVAKE